MKPPLDLAALARGSGRNPRQRAAGGMLARLARLARAALAGSLLTPALFAESLGGGSYSLTGGPVTGGGQSGGGTFAVAGTAGNTSVDVSKGGDFQVTGGLIGVAVVPGDFALTIGFAPDGQILISWPAEASGYVLESTPTVGEFANWQPVTPPPAGNTHTTPNDQALRFFRLRKP